MYFGMTDLKYLEVGKLWYLHQYVNFWRTQVRMEYVFKYYLDMK